MPKSWSEPFLWIHLAGIFTLPLWLLVCAFGLASGEALFPLGLERLLVALLGILPIVAMQCYRPFNIFSLLFLALPPEQLNDDRRRILAAFRAPEHRWLTGAAAILLLYFLQDLYSLSPLLAELSPFSAGSTTPLVRFAIATGAFFAANLFFQVPLAVMRVMAMPDEDLDAIEPVTSDEADSGFFLLGWQKENLLKRYGSESPESSTAIDSQPTESEPDASSAASA